MMALLPANFGVAEDPQTKRMRELAASLTAGGTTAPKLAPGVQYGWGQGLSQIAQALSGAYVGRQADQRVEQQSSAAQQALAQAMTTGDLSSLAAIPQLAPYAIQAQIGKAEKQEDRTFRAGERAEDRAAREADRATQQAFQEQQQARAQQAAASLQSAQLANAREIAALSRSERSEDRAEARRLQAENAPLVEIADPNSATGTRYVRRSEAVDQPGKPPTGMEITSDGKGGFTMTQGAAKPKSGGGGMTESQANSGNYANRMVESERRMDTVVGGGYSPGNIRDQAAAWAPGGNFVMSDQGQLYQQAQRDWVRAKLRKESGAAIGAQEEANEIKTYFPQPGDKPDVIEQKRRARETAVQSLMIGAGPSAQSVGQLPPSPGAPATTSINVSKGPAQTTGQRARNPKTGEEVEWNGTAWQAVR